MGGGSKIMLGVVQGAEARVVEIARPAFARESESMSAWREGLAGSWAVSARNSAARRWARAGQSSMKVFALSCWKT